MQSAPQKDPSPTSSMTQESTLLDQIIENGRLVRHDSDRQNAKYLIDEFVNRILPLCENTSQVDLNLENTILEQIQCIDEAISNQLNEIMHNPELQKLEASWRGLSQLVQNTETGERLKIRVLPATKRELTKDFAKASEFDQSAMFKKIYEAEYGVFGGQPFGVLVGDFEFGRGVQDVQLLDSISHVAAAAHAPFISAASPELFNVNDWTELDNPRDLKKIFSSVDYVQWNAFRNSEDSRYVALTLPRYMARLPYGPDTIPVEDFDFQEDVNGNDHSKYLWANASYKLAERLTDAFAKYGWTTAIRGVEGGGLVQNLPAHTYQTQEGALAMKVPTEVGITDRREKELSELGFLSLVHCSGENYAAFFGAQTANKPKTYIEDNATANAELSSRLPYVLATSRIAHFLKSIVRDKVGGFESKDSLQKYLEGWVSQYVLLNDNASQAQKAKKPLREATIVVEEIPGQPGSYRAVAHLRPHFQLESVNVSLRLVASLPST